MKVAIIGAGIGGLSAAACLARAGIDAEVFERAPEIRELGAGVSLWPNATRVLERMGLLGKCLEKSAPLESLEIRTREGRRLLDTRIDLEKTPVICMRRPDLLEVLHAEVPRGRIHLNHSCVRIQDEGDRVLVGFEGGETRRFDCVIGADGVRSIARVHVCGARLEPVYRGYVIWRGVCDFPVSCRILEIWDRGRRFGILPMGAGGVCWYATDSRPRETVSRTGHMRELLRLFDDWPAPIPQIIRATSERRILMNPATDISVPKPWARGRVALIGDAAHPLTPNVGQGCCLALEDSYAIAQVLGGTLPLAEKLSRFAEKRYRRAARIVKITRWIGNVGQSGMGRVLAPAMPIAFEALVRPIHRHDATRLAF